MEALYSLGKQIRFYKYCMNNFEEDAFETTYKVLTKSD